jgi:hypothetical protein
VFALIENMDPLQLYIFKEGKVKLKKTPIIHCHSNEENEFLKIENLIEFLDVNSSSTTDIH